MGGLQVLRNFSLKIQANGFDSVLLEFIPGIPVQLSSRDLEAPRQSVPALTAKPAGGRALLAIPPGAGILPLAAKELCNISTETFCLG